ncbi:MAG: hypothetical protein HY257_02910 [Chloroflexi bacterium]|nr:hypothetical protein [Chloroflexota bacterium]
MDSTVYLTTYTMLLASLVEYALLLALIAMALLIGLLAWGVKFKFKLPKSADGENEKLKLYGLPAMLALFGGALVIVLIVLFTQPTGPTTDTSVGVPTDIKGLPQIAHAQEGTSAPKPCATPAPQGETLAQVQNESPTPAPTPTGTRTPPSITKAEPIPTCTPASISIPPGINLLATPKINIACIPGVLMFDPPDGKSFAANNTVLRWRTDYQLRPDEMFAIHVSHQNPKPMGGMIDEKPIGLTREQIFSIDLTKWDNAGKFGDFYWLVRIRGVDGTYRDCEPKPISFQLIGLAQPAAPQPQQPAAPPASPPTATPRR